MSKQFYFKKFSLAYVHSLVLFDPRIVPYYVLPLRAIEDLWVDDNEGVLNISGTSPLDCLVPYVGHLLVESYQSAEMQSVYFKASPADWVLGVR